jgi:hypothetical protein
MELTMKLAYVLSLIFCALLMGTTFAHVLEIWPKARMPAELWTTLQHKLYRGFGTVGGAAEMAALASSTVFAVTMRGQPRFALALAAAICFASAFFVVFLVVIVPVNRQVLAWDPAHVPSDWPHLRQRWDAGHTLRFALHLLGFILLAAIPVLSPRVLR